MDNRSLLAIVLSVFVLIGFQFYTEFTAPKPVSVPIANSVSRQQEPEAKPAIAIPPISGVAAIAPLTDTIAEDVKAIKVETPLYVVTLTSKGGVPLSWRLKSHKDTNGRDVTLLAETAKIKPLSIGAKGKFIDGNFIIKGGDLMLDNSNKTGAVTFEYANAGHAIRRTYSFAHDRYRVDVRDEVTGLPEYEITLGADFGVYDKLNTDLHVGPVVLQDEKRLEYVTTDVDVTKDLSGGIKWIALEDKYFFSALIPLTPIDNVKVWKLENDAAISFVAKEGVHDMALYAGPKELERLQTLGLGIEHIVDFGFFSIVARPIFWLLMRINDFIGNFGWSIIVLTIIVRIPFIPIIHKGQQSMKQLQAIQPKMNDIREQFKKDPARMQQEMMGLYKKHKVNPMGGCLPILIQIPVFFALYKVLMVAIEMRGAPFIFWVHDLSAKDPYYVLPLVMGATMFIQQKMTPATGDPKQQKIMMFMPIIFTFMFLNFASGLVLYWLINNLLAISQQYYVNKQTT